MYTYIVEFKVPVHHLELSYGGISSCILGIASFDKLRTNTACFRVKCLEQFNLLSQFLPVVLCVMHKILKLIAFAQNHSLNALADIIFSRLYVIMARLYLCMRAAKALASLCICARSREFSLLDNNAMTIA